ncbi:MAG TPA: NAD(P)/FAD-dependent oxidoreductase [Euryarchaeota archaeon]|nr:NAD(P)/FAD-dependent oxidoreductase [Euryarchaeota archaeon]
MRVIIVGGGAGGTIVANRLSRLLSDMMDRGDLEIVVLDKSEYHYYQPGYLFVALGEEEPEHFIRKERELLDENIKFYHGDQGEVVKIMARENKLQTKDGKVWDYDYIVIALGSQPYPDAIPGLKEGSYSFYTLEDAIKLRDALYEFKSGKIVVGITMLPYKCLVAQYEILFALHDLFLKEKRDAKFEYFFPLKGTHQHPAVSQVGERWMVEKGIKIYAPFNVTKVDPDKKVIYSKENIEIKYDLLIVVPPHISPRVVRDSGLANMWIPTDPYTLKSNEYDNMYLLGDITDIQGVPKAGSVADSQALVVAKNIASRIKKTGLVYKYDGSAFCFIMHSMDEAGYLYMNYTKPPIISLPSKYAMWMKMLYNELYWGMTLKAEI